MFGYRKKNRVAPAVILEQMAQQEVDRRSGQGRPSVMNAWAPSLAEPVTGLHDIQFECDKDDPQRVWRLGILLGEARKEVNEKQRWIEMLHDSLTKKGVTIGKHEREITRLQTENDVQGVQLGEHEGEIKRLQAENDALRQTSLGKVSTMLVKDLQDNEVSVPLCCPITHQLFKDPVVSRFGHSFEREDIETWLLKKSTCPVTNQCMTIADLSPNRALADVVEAFRAQQL
jgi:hypothetical protein